MSDNPPPESFKVAIEHIPKEGRMTRFDAFGERILLANVDGILRAVSDTCTHEDASLSNGALKADTVACPLHGSRFCLRTGLALDEPAELPLKVYPVQVINDEVYLRVPETQ
ncbi:MAG: 3-phenylpropionate/cinnamic acid dioxygenase ferredoxin subunit [marine bacterium B5-7]|nr:MAG: 3-phenylpropionate/cinnamic acid dioxygenase ferredoxin subunit [marine bacterium B5-7]